jgi:DnaJ-domain-containing protein 1
MDTYAQKISHLKALYHLACADNVLTKAEAVYIRNVAERLGVDPKELEKFEAHEPELDLPDTEYKTQVLFHRLVIITMIDNEMTDLEKQYCTNLGVKMGLHPQAVNEIIELIKTRGTMRVMPMDIANIFRKYSN